MLGQACTYLACAPKSNAAYKAIDAALASVRETGSLPVPDHLKSRPLKSESAYLYPHDHGGHVVQQHLPELLAGARFYVPKEAGYESHLRARLRAWRGEGER